MILLFPEGLLFLLIAGSIVLTGVGAVTLVALFISDYKKGKVW